MSKKHLFLGFLLLGTAFWGISFSLVKIGIANQSSFLFLFHKFLLAAIALATLSYPILPATSINYPSNVAYFFDHQHSPPGRRLWSTRLTGWDNQWLPQHSNYWTGVLFAALPATAFMYTVQNIGRRYPAEEQGALTYLCEPLFASLTRVLLSGEAFSWRIL